MEGLVIGPGTGLTEEERNIVMDLVRAWNQFTALPCLGADDRDDFRRAIHEAQRIIAQRALARVYPEFWR